MGVQKRHVLGTASSLLVLLFPLAGGVLVALGQDRKDAADWTGFTVGSVMIFIAAIVEFVRKRRARNREVAESTEAVRLRVAMKDALQPVAELIASMPAMTKSQRQARLKEVCRQAVGALCLLLKDVDRLRSVVYRVDDDQTSMSQVAYLGRGDTPRAFVSNDFRGQKALETVRDGGYVFVPDLDQQRPSNYAGTANGYRTFISAAICNGAAAYGMVTVDAPNANDLVDTDCQIVLLMADLLAIAFAEADRS